MSQFHDNTAIEHLIQTLTLN